jgi:hypothetical protein
MIVVVLAAAALFIQAAPQAAQTSGADPLSDAFVQRVRPAANSPSSPSTTVSQVVVSAPVSVDKRAVAISDLDCHEEVSAGTLLAHKTCAPPADFAERTRQAQEAVRDWQHIPVPGR